MYNDYEVIYKSNINEYLIYWIILGIIGIAIILFMFFSLSKVYKKANRSGLAPWIPIYNAYLLVEIANLSMSYFILLLIPFINILAIFKISMNIAKLFKRSTAFGYGLFFLPFIFYPILAFNDSEYIGINLFALQGKTTVEDIPVIDENKNKEIEVKVNEDIDIASRNINISIGGGKYQKDYTANLVDVDRDKVLNKAEAELKVKNNPSNIFINNELINKVEEAVVKEEKNNNDIFSVPFINNQQQPVDNINKTSDNVNNTNVTAGNNNEEIASLKTDGKYNVCPNCGTRVSEGAKICFICGQTLE